MPFTIDEKTIIKMYSGAELNQDMVFQSISESIPFVENAEIKALMEGVLRKIRAMSAEEFSKINIADVLEYETDEN